MTNGVLIIFFIPSNTVRRELFPVRFSDFGLTPKKSFICLSHDEFESIPDDNLADVLLIEDKEINERYSAAFIKFTLRFVKINIALHKSSMYKTGQRKFFKQYFRKKKLTFKEFSRSDRDRLYQSLIEISQVIKKDNNGDSYQKSIAQIIEYFTFDSELEESLRNLHAKISIKRNG